MHSRIPTLFLCLVSGMPAVYADESGLLIDRLRQTRAVNVEAVIDAQFEQGEAAAGFRVPDPYAPKTAAVVQRWDRDSRPGEQVCTIRFRDPHRTRYELRGFGSPRAAYEAGFAVTHRGRCGSCSTLRDLAVYLSSSDLTTLARQCARRFGLTRKKQCFQQRLGLTPYCAESWAYNAMNTRRECLGVCVADYGFWNLLFNRHPGPNADASGRLRPCLQCDEDQSGPGFRYSAGRTRRNSGIQSAIPRPASQIFRVDHSLYFR